MLTERQRYEPVISELVKAAAKDDTKIRTHFLPLQKYTHRRRRHRDGAEIKSYQQFQDVVRSASTSERFMFTG
jgi:hypothetical protein